MVLRLQWEHLTEHDLRWLQGLLASHRERLTKQQDMLWREKLWENRLQWFVTNLFKDVLQHRHNVG